jgi:putative hemolysin/acyl carrier protein
MLEQQIYTRDIICEEMISILEDKDSDIKEFKDDDGIFDELNFSSLDLAQLISILETRLQIDPFEELVPLTRIRSVKDLIQAYEKCLPSSLDKEFSRITFETIGVEQGRSSLLKKLRYLSFDAPEKHSLLEKGLRRALRKISGINAWESMLMRSKSMCVSEADFHKHLIEELRLTLAYNEESLDNIPKEGPLVVVANHPFGLVDTAVINYLLSLRRPDCKLLAYDWGFGNFSKEHSFFLTFPDKKTKDVFTHLDIKSIEASMEYVREGGGIVIFPAGIVSSAPRPFSYPTDTEWKPFAAKIILETNATVVPFYFDGRNSAPYSLFSYFSNFLFLSTIIRENLRKKGTTVDIHIGKAVSKEDTHSFSDPVTLTKHLRFLTYGLSNKVVS